jgi:hypothetical protein
MSDELARSLRLAIKAYEDHKLTATVDLLREAADEIKRLREALTEIEWRASGFHHGDTIAQSLVRGIGRHARTALEAKP